MRPTEPIYDLSDSMGIDPVGYDVDLDGLLKELETMKTELRKAVYESGNQRAAAVYGHLGRVIQELSNDKRN